MPSVGWFTQLLRVHSPYGRGETDHHVVRWVYAKGIMKRSLKYHIYVDSPCNGLPAIQSIPDGVKGGRSEAQVAIPKLEYELLQHGFFCGSDQILLWADIVERCANT